MALKRHRRFNSLHHLRNLGRMKFDWIKDIDNYKSYFTESERRMIELIGLENFILLNKEFRGTSHYFSDRSITTLKKKWAQKNKNIPYDEAARSVGVSKTTIYNWREEIGANDPGLFDKEK